MQDYQLIMHSLSSELHQARGLGREEGVRAMEIVAQQLTELMERMYQEGQGIQQRCLFLESTLITERDKATTSMEQTQKHLQVQSQAWVLECKAELEKLYNVEKAELRAMIQKEHEPLQQQYHRFDQSQADSALKKLEMVEQFHQPKKEFQKKYGGSAVPQWKSTKGTVMWHHS